MEATAAQRYWPLLFRDPAFRRRFDAPDQNALLNYGYAIIRAAVGRAIAAAGLHPSLGIRHKGRGNAYCLADDLVEPYRPLVDAEVAKMVGERGTDAPLDDAAKRRLVELLELRLQARTGAPDMRTVGECIGMTAFSLAAAFGATRPSPTDETPARSPRQRTEGSVKLFFPVGLVQW